MYVCYTFDRNYRIFAIYLKELLFLYKIRNIPYLILSWLAICEANLMSVGPLANHIDYKTYFT